MGEPSRFTFQEKFSRVISMCPEGMRGQLLEAVWAYGAYGEEPNLEFPLDTIFEGIREDIDYTRTACASGSKGGKKARKPLPKARKGDAADKPQDPSEGCGADPSEGSDGNPSEGCADNPSEGSAETLPKGSGKPLGRVPGNPSEPTTRHDKTRQDTARHVGECAHPREEGGEDRRAVLQVVPFSGGVCPPDPEPPGSVEEVRAYCECDAPFCDPEAFFDTYAARGWRDAAGTPVVDWRAKARKWHREERDKRMRRAAEEAAARERSKPAETAEQRAQRLQREFRAKYGDLPPDMAGEAS